MQTGVLTEGTENSASATATGPSAWTSGSPSPPPHSGGRGKRPPRTVGLGFGFGGALHSDSEVPRNEGVGAGGIQPGRLCHRAPGLPATGKRRHLRRCAVDACIPRARGCRALHIHLLGAHRGPGPCRVSAGLSFPARRGLRHCPQCGTRPRLGWEPTLRERHLQGAPGAEAAAGGAGAAGGDARSREGPAAQARAGGGPRPKLASEGGKDGPGWGPQAPGTSARAAGPGGTHRAWAPGRRRPARGPLAGSPPSATRALLQPRSGGSTDSCVAALEGRGHLRSATGGRTGRSGSSRGRGGSRVRSRPPLQVPGPPPAASAAPASPTPRLRSAPCISPLPGRGRAGLRVRSRPPCEDAVRTRPRGSPCLPTALCQRLCPAGGAQRR
nr:uncharacterized protein LOC105485938 [Macaca nemestrina]